MKLKLLNFVQALYIDQGVGVPVSGLLFLYHAGEVPKGPGGDGGGIGAKRW